MAVGRHVVLDVRTRSARGLDDLTGLGALLSELGDALGMHVIDGPRMHPFPNGGATGVVVWATSHASIHTWPETCQVALDAYSCTEFAAAQVLDVVRRHLDVEAIAGVDIERGGGPPTTRVIAWP